VPRWCSNRSFLGTGQPEHLARHPFGKVPVVDHDGFRILETSAIAPYLDEVLPGPSFMPDNVKDRARMRMAIGIIDSYGYDALVGVVGYRLFPDFIGGKNEESRQQCVKTSKLVLQELMKLRSDDNFIAGERRSLAELHLAPICFYVALTTDAAEVFGVKGFTPWWERMQALPSYDRPRRNWASGGGEARIGLVTALWTKRLWETFTTHDFDCYYARLLIVRRS
jgi:glutathione S-transferase